MCTCGLPEGLCGCVRGEYFPGTFFSTSPMCANTGGGVRRKIEVMRKKSKEIHKMHIQTQT